MQCINHVLKCNRNADTWLEKEVHAITTTTAEKVSTTFHYFLSSNNIHSCMYTCTVTTYFFISFTELEVKSSIQLGSILAVAEQYVDSAGDA